MTNASGDPFLVWIEDKWGPRGLGWYWKLLEIIAGRGRIVESGEDGKPTFAVGISWRDLTRNLRTKRGTARNFLRSCTDFVEKLRGLYPESIKVTHTENGEFLRLDCPNLLKIKDDYTRKSVHPPHQTGSPSGIKGKGYRKEEKGERGAASTAHGGPSSRPRSGEEIRKESIAHAKNMTPQAARAALDASSLTNIPLDPELMEILQGKAGDQEQNIGTADKKAETGSI